MRAILRAASWALIAVSAANLLPTWSWIQEIIRNSSHYLAAANAAFLLLVLVFSASSRARRREAPLHLLFAIYFTLPLLPFLVSGRHGGVNEAAGTRIKLLLVNVHNHGGDPRRLAELMLREKPDLAALIEFGPRWQGVLDIEGFLPYAIEVPREDDYGLALYSRFPFEGDPRTTLGEDVPPIIMTSVILEPERRITVSAVHIPPPKSQAEFVLAEITARRLGTMLRHMPGEHILAGDLNATPYSKYYRRVSSSGRLRSAYKGQGFFATWNAREPLLRFALDHVFVRGALRASSIERLEPIGSDHYPLMVHLDLGTPADQPNASS